MLEIETILDPDLLYRRHSSSNAKCSFCSLRSGNETKLPSLGRLNDLAASPPIPKEVIMR
jgi:hypothetical protein